VGTCLFHPATHARAPGSAGRDADGDGLADEDVVPDWVGVGVGVDGEGDGVTLGDGDGDGDGLWVRVEVVARVVGGAGLTGVDVVTAPLEVRLAPGLGRVVRCVGVVVVDGTTVGAPPESWPPCRNAAIPVPTTMTSTSPSSAIIGSDTDRRREPGRPPESKSATIGSGAVGGRWYTPG
jgi:hypothetical protein